MWVFALQTSPLQTVVHRCDVCCDISKGDNEVIVCKADITSYPQGGICFANMARLLDRRSTCHHLGVMSYPQNTANAANKRRCHQR